jgi:hypothetical protein
MLTFAVGFIWIKSISFLALSETLGPLIITIKSMMKDIVLFLSLYCSILVFFICIGNLMFFDLDDFSSGYWETAVYLYSASLGSFAFADFKNAMIGTTVGEVYLMFFLLFNLVLLLNLLIALLSSTYAFFESKTKSLFLGVVLENGPFQRNDKDYGALITTYSPINVIIGIPALFILLITPKKRKVNNFLQHLEFIPLFIIYFSVYIGVNLAL